MAFPGFNKSKRKNSISNGDWDKDGVKNRKDCEPLNYKRQGNDHDPWYRETKPPKCPKCGAQTYLQDDSFSHEFGTESIIYPECPKCGWQEE